MEKNKSLLDSKVWTAVISFALAFALWLYVVTTNSTDFEATFHNITVVHQNESLLAERGLMIVADQTPNVDLKLSGNRTDINSLNSSNITVTVDLSTIWEPGTVALEYKVSYPGNIPPNSVITQDRSPSRVTLKIEQKIAKPVPVQVFYSGSVPEGFIADKENVELEHRELLISGPKSVMDKVGCVRIDVDLEGQSQSLGGMYPFTLCDEAGEPVDAALVSVPVEEISLMLKIQRVKELTIGVQVEDGGGATQATSSITVSHPTIRISGPDSLLEGLDSLTVGTIRLGELLKDETLTFPIALPEGVNNETGVSEVTVEVKFPALATKTFTVTDIKAVNVPEGLEAEIFAQALEVRIRGPKELMNKMTAEDISVTVDFSGEPEGTVTKKATVTVAEGYDGAGAVGTYSVSATLRSTDGDN